MQKIIITISIALLFICSFANAENIDPYETGAQYSWSENTGWLNFEPNTGSGVHVYSDRLEGFVWGENIGWINLSPATYGGVSNDGAGNLSGYAWGENVGWINFDPNYPLEPKNNPTRVRINADGKFSGWAWGENIGWIKFDSAQVHTAMVCIVGLDDLHNFATDWLTTAPAANLDGSGDVDTLDLGIFASYWLDYCPNNWGLK